ncbi:MAG TPA: hypothetical protein GXX49_07605 [Clostridiaceae bacterium]|jgi:hypothetical protein|nr:hypothetical protein [Clostridiaceae bacterium]
MVNGISKKIVVIKNVPSNIIEEAILILKNDNDKYEAAAINSEAARKRRKWKNEYLLKEAEDIISAFIKEHNIMDGSTMKKLDKNETQNKNKSFITNTVINSALVCSILLLLYVITRII